MNFYSETFLSFVKGHSNHCTEQLPRETEQTGTSPDEHVNFLFDKMHSYKREEFCANFSREWHDWVIDLCPLLG